MSGDELKSISDQLNSNHLEVCQRLSIIETNMKNNREAYGDIPSRVLKLEKFDEKVKVMGSVAAAGLSAGWAAMLVWMRKG